MSAGVEFISGGRPQGKFGQSLQKFGWDDGYLRPFYNSKDEPCVTVNTGKVTEKDGKLFYETETRRIADLERAGIRHPVFNATSLRFADWIHFENRLIMATRQVLRAWADLSSANTVGGFDAMASMTYEYEAVTDLGEVMVSMEGRASGRDFQPEIVNSSIPLPIFHVDSTIGMRYDLISKKRGTPMSAVKIEQAGRRIAEHVEDQVIGIATGSTIIGPTYGTRTGFHPHREGSRVYGMLNHPSRQTKTDLVTPTGSNPNSVVDDVLEMRELLYDAGFSGPFMLYHSTDWNVFMDDDYGQIGTGSGYGFAPNKTLRNRLREIEDIADVRQLRRLTSSTNPFTLIMMEMSSNVAAAINGATPRTVQWETKGGWETNYRTYAIQVPVFYYDANGNMGLVVGTTS